ncbi:MAG: histidine kinase [Bacteroidetes bacterium]|nr:histidine kinase [Bacteroidota bacterium]
MFRKRNAAAKKWRHSLALFIFLFGSFSSGFSQSLNFRNYSVDDGLPFVEVYTIFQDANGNLWSGGYGGLSRFDGISFTNFSPRSGLPNHWVTSISEDGNHDLWVGTISGVSRYSENKFTNYKKQDGLPDDYVNCLLHDNSNVLWIGTSKGICKYNGDKFLSDTSEGPHKNFILCFYQQQNSQKVWIGTDHGVFLFENGKYTYFDVALFGNNSITALTADKNGNIIAGTSDGIFRLEDGHFKLILTPQGFDMPAVNSMITDRNGITWIGSGNGLYSFDGKKFTYYRISNSDVNADNVVSLYEDYEGSLWLGTHTGIFRFRGEGFISYGTAEGLNSSFIFGIDKDKNGKLWVCSENDGAYKYDASAPAGKKFIRFSKEEGLASDKSNTVCAMENNDVWIGTDRGLSVITNGKAKNFHRSNGLNSDTVNCIFRDRKGRLWLGGGKGITLYENGKFIPYYISTDPEMNFDVWCIADDDDGKLWVGTYTAGLYVFDTGTGKFSDGRKKLGISADSYFSVCEDKQGKLYFGTLDGIFIYDHHTTDHVGEENGLSSELIYCMSMDKEKNFLWAGTNQGLSRLDVNAYDKDGSKIITTFGKEEGFSGVESNTNGTYLDEDGVIWFGTVNGLIRYSPDDFVKNSAYTKTSITGVRLFYNDTALANGALLNWDDNNISFDYVGICLTNPAKVQYQFMLEGFDSKFSPPTKERTARYSNLPPGNYTFKVISANNEGLWNNDPAAISFTIETPVWKQAWFWLLLTGISISILGLAILWRIRLIKNKERVESEVQVALARNELKALRAQMNPHFVFNSLNSIQHFILTNKSADAGKYLNKFARLMRVILNNSEKSVIALSEEIEYLKLYLGLEEMRFENKFEWSIEVEKDIDADFFEIPAMLLQPYVENAILHGLTPAKQKGHLKISMKLKGETLVCTIEDNGIGRERAREMRQFSKRKDDKSLGMKITHDRLELINRLHGSQLSLAITDLYHEDKSPAGTRVDIFIPVS